MHRPSTTATKPARSAVFGAVFAALVFAVGTPAAADEGAIVLAQNEGGGGFLPNLFGNRNREGGANAALRIEQLENQVRLLTGEVERLSFEVRQLKARLDAAAGGAPVPPATATPGAGTGSLGTLPAPADDGAPVDLSTLNPGGAAAARPAPPAAGNAARTDATTAFDAARLLFDAGRYDEAERSLRSFVGAYPADPRAGEAAFLIGEILLARGENREAANVFLASYTDFPAGPKAPESLLKLGIALGGMGEREAACSSFRELLGAYPDAAAAVRQQAERELAAAGCA